MIFEIPSPLYLIELKNEVKTKTRHLDEGAVLVRKGQKQDEVRTATPDEIENIKIELEKYRDTKQKINSEKVTDTEGKPERSIGKTVQIYIDKNSSYSLDNNYPVRVKNWKEGIVYEVYRLIDGFNGKK